MHLVGGLIHVNDRLTHRFAQTEAVIHRDMTWQYLVGRCNC